MKPKAPTEQVAFRIQRRLRRRLEILANSRERTMTYLVEKAIEQYLEKEEKAA